MTHGDHLAAQQGHEASVANPAVDPPASGFPIAGLVLGVFQVDSAP